MSITCKDLLDLESFKTIKLVAGRNGLDNVITWVSATQMESTSDCLNRGELLVIADSSHKEERMQALLDECIRNNIPGMVMLVSKRHSANLSDELLSRADEAAFPLFTMHWEQKLSDVSKKIIKLIMFEKTEQEKEQDLLRQLIFTPPDKQEKMTCCTWKKDMQPDDFCFVGLFFVDAQLSARERLQRNISNMCEMNNISVQTMLSANNVLCLFNDPSEKRIHRSLNHLKRIREALDMDCGNGHLLLAVGEICKGLQTARKSYGEALAAMDALQHIDGQLVIDYHDLGIYRLLQMQDKDELCHYCRKQLGVLDDCEGVASVDLLDTLQTYLRCRCNLSLLAEHLGIHRNTASYRMVRIKELLGRNLEDPTVLLELSLAFVIRNYLE